MFLVALGGIKPQAVEHDPRFRRCTHNSLEVH